MKRTCTNFGVGSVLAPRIRLLLISGFVLVGWAANGLAQGVNMISQPERNQAMLGAVFQQECLQEKLAALRVRLQRLDQLGQLEKPALSRKVAEENAAVAVESPAKDSATLPPAEPGVVPEPAFTQVGSTALSSTLLESFETILKNMPTTTEGNPLNSRPKIEQTAAELAKFVSEKIEYLDRIIRLIEQKHTMQADISAFQKRLEDLQNKVNARKGGAKIVAQK